MSAPRPCGVIHHLLFHALCIGSTNTYNPKYRNNRHLSKLSELLANLSFVSPRVSAAQSHDPALFNGTLRVFAKPTRGSNIQEKGTQFPVTMLAHFRML